MDEPEWDWKEEAEHDGEGDGPVGLADSEAR